MKLSLSRSVRPRCFAALFLLAADGILRTWVVLMFTRAQSISPALSVGLFIVNHLLFLFPLAMVLLAFVGSKDTAA